MKLMAPPVLQRREYSENAPSALIADTKVSGVAVDVVRFFQRLLNPGSIERFADRIGIKIPVGQFFQETELFHNLVAQAFPVGTEYFKGYVANYHDYFINAPAEQVAQELVDSGVISTKQKCITVFGIVICFGEEETPWSTYLLIGGGVFLLGYLFLKS